MARIKRYIFQGPSFWVTPAVLVFRGVFVKDHNVSSIFIYPLEEKKHQTLGDGDWPSLPKNPDPQIQESQMTDRNH